MADGFIVRKGGVAVERTTAPSINFVSKTDSEIVVTFTNNDAAEAEVFFGITSTLTDTVTLAAAATSSNITFSGLDDETAFTVSAFALVTNPTSKKIKSEIVTSTITTDKFVFDPATLSPQLWMDAADASTITASSGSVSQWNNKGSLGNFTQGTGASQPTTGVTTLNSLNVIDFDADVLQSANTNEWTFLHDGTVTEIFVVVKFGTTANPGVNYGLLNNHLGSRGFRIFYSDTPNNDRIIHNIVGSGFFVSNQDTANDFWTPNQFGILSVLSDPSNATAANRSEIRKNGGTAEKNNTQTNSPTTNNPETALFLGGLTQTSTLLVGSIAELIVISGSNVTSGNRTDIIDYLADKWGITL